jgi:phytoene synthase
MRKDSLLSKHAKTFYWAGFFLPKETFTKCSHLYDFCRTLDDIADQKKELSFKKKQFKIFKTKFKEKNNSLPVIKNIWRLIEKENISKKIILDLFDGVESDLKKKVRITSRNNLFLYSYRVAGTVGLMMAKILKVKKKGSLMGAIDLGVAMQLTNIARDVIEDKKNNRFYINHDFNSIKKTIQMADIFYLYSLNSIRDIPISFRFSILVARRIYRQIGYEILKEKNINNYNEAGKIYVSKIKKCIQTFFSLIDFIQILCAKSKNTEISNLYSIVKKKINLYERI